MEKPAVSQDTNTQSLTMGNPQTPIINIKLYGALHGSSSLLMRPDATFLDLKIKLAERLDSLPCMVKVIHNGRVLKDKLGSTLRDLGFGGNSRCFVINLPKDDVLKRLVNKMRKNFAAMKAFEESNLDERLQLLIVFPQKSELIKIWDGHRAKNRDADYKVIPVEDYLSTTQSTLPLESRITEGMRQKTVDILSGITYTFQMSKVSLHLGVATMDKYLSVVPCHCKWLLLVGVISLFVAATEVDPRAPKLQHFSWVVADYHLSFEELETMIYLVRKAVDDDIKTPIMLSYLKGFRTGENDTDYCGSLLDLMFTYLGNLSLEIYACVTLPIKEVATSVALVSRYLVQPGRPPWDAGMVERSGFTAWELRDTAEFLYQYFLEADDKNETYMFYVQNLVKVLQPLDETIPFEYFFDPD